VLQAAGVRFTPLVEIGAPAACIARVAAEHNCDGIVMGSRGMGAAAAEWARSRPPCSAR